MTIGSISSGRRIRELAFIDPLARDGQDLPTADPIEKASLAMANHPDVRLELEDMQGVLKKAGLKPRDRKVLLMRRNGDIMSHKDVADWKRSQRAINGNHSELTRTISSATK